MIGSLRGEIVFVGLNRIEIDTNGIGWDVFVPVNTLNKLKTGERAEFFIHHHVTDKSNELYGFLARDDKGVFEMLLNVPGVGPKTALAVFGVGKGERIVRAIIEADVDFFRQVKGLGNKTSQRIIIDLKNKVGGVKDLDLASAGKNEIVYQALVSLGFRTEEVRGVIPKIPPHIESEDEKIKYCLKELDKRK